MSLHKATQLYETDTHYVVRKTTVVDGVKSVSEKTYPKTEEGFEAAWDDDMPMLSRPGESSEP